MGVSSPDMCPFGNHIHCSSCRPDVYLVSSSNLSRAEFLKGLLRPILPSAPLFPSPLQTASAAGKPGSTGTSSFSYMLSSNLFTSPAISPGQPPGSLPHTLTTELEVILFVCLLCCCAPLLEQEQHILFLLTSVSPTFSPVPES